LLFWGKIIGVVILEKILEKYRGGIIGTVQINLGVNIDEKNRDLVVVSEKIRIRLFKIARYG
jgi:hypothetical protein